ncbi:MAG: endolytic transglycosylase MltG [Prevotellaceae bacterium]|nr:endolytic transglycosylase MltG [Prevotellaceae bacterium]
MNKSKNTKPKKLFFPIIACIAVIIIGLIYYYFFSSMLKHDENKIVYIDDNDNIDSIYAKLDPISSNHGMAGFKTLVRHSSYEENIRTGRYEIEKGNGAFTVFRKLKNGLQTSVNLTIPSVRTIDKLAGAISKKMMIDSVALYKALTDSSTCAKYGYTPQTIACMFIPNTYEIYWNTPIDKFLDRMKKEENKFWSFERTKKAEAMNFTKEQVITLASIVDEETANDKEKPMIAGMYYNRLKTGMPLQADPTIKYALNDFSIRRIYHNMLMVSSPYNTYKNTGLPPGPIRIPSVAGIDAVLDHVHHDYLYMCAKEDFSGTHNFAKTYEEHLENAEKYSKALNERGIK